MDVMMRAISRKLILVSSRAELLGKVLYTEMDTPSNSPCYNKV